MLVFSRQVDDSIVIGNDVVVTVVDIRGDKARLGINAPREVSVHRKEVYDAIYPGGKPATKPTVTISKGEDNFSLIFDGKTVATVNHNDAVLEVVKKTLTAFGIDIA